MPPPLNLGTVLFRSFVFLRPVALLMSLWGLGLARDENRGGGIVYRRSHLGT